MNLEGNNLLLLLVVAVAVALFFCHYKVEGDLDIKKREYFPFNSACHPYGYSKQVGGMCRNPGFQP